MNDITFAKSIGTDGVLEVKGRPSTDALYTSMRRSGIDEKTLSTSKPLREILDAQGLSYLREADALTRQNLAGNPEWQEGFINSRGYIDPGKALNYLEGVRKSHSEALFVGTALYAKFGRALGHGITFGLWDPLDAAGEAGQELVESSAGRAPLLSGLSTTLGSLVAMTAPAGPLAGVSAGAKFALVRAGLSEAQAATLAPVIANGLVTGVTERDVGAGVRGAAFAALVGMIGRQLKGADSSAFGAGMADAFAGVTSDAILQAIVDGKIDLNQLAADAVAFGIAGAAGANPLSESDGELAPEGTRVTPSDHSEASGPAAGGPEPEPEHSPEPQPEPLADPLQPEGTEVQPSETDASQSEQGESDVEPPESPDECDCTDSEPEDEPELPEGQKSNGRNDEGSGYRERSRSGGEARASERVPPGQRRTPEDWTPEEAAARVKELEADGHGPQRHEGDVTLEDQARRVRDGVDPMTGSARDGVTGGQHRAPATSSAFKSNEAYAQAESAARGSPEFSARSAQGTPTIEVSVPLEDALGPNYLKHVDGVSKAGARQGTLNRVDYTGGRVVAVYERTSTGYSLKTMYPAPR